MKNVTDANLSNAEMVYTVANTPMFIARKLRSDPTCIKTSTDLSSEEIIREIKSLLQTTPKTTRDLVMPLVLLSALSLKQDKSALLKISDIDSSKYRWFDLVLDVYLKTTKQTTSTSFSMINSTSKFTVRKSETETTFSKVISQ